MAARLFSPFIMLKRFLYFFYTCQTLVREYDWKGPTIISIWNQILYWFNENRKFASDRVTKSEGLLVSESVV
jgi:hypothetical protein